MRSMIQQAISETSVESAKRFEQIHAERTRALDAEWKQRIDELDQLYSAKLEASQKHMEELLKQQVKSLQDRIDKLEEMAKQGAHTSFAPSEAGSTHAGSLGGTSNQSSFTNSRRGWQAAYVEVLGLCAFNIVRDAGVEDKTFKSWYEKIQKLLPSTLTQKVDWVRTFNASYTHPRHHKAFVYLLESDTVLALALRNCITKLQLEAMGNGDAEGVLFGGEVKKVRIEVSPSQVPINAAVYNAFAFIERVLGIAKGIVVPAWPKDKLHHPLRFVVATDRVELITYNVGDGWAIVNLAALKDL